METSKELKQRMEALSHREWDLPVIKERFYSLVENGIPKKPISREGAIGIKTKSWIGCGAGRKNIVISPVVAPKVHLWHCWRNLDWVIWRS